jgi:methylglutaconyl-CoA hydratase
MFDGIEAALLQLEALTAANRFHPLQEPPPADSVRVVRVRALGSAFCSGFDLGLLADDPDPAQPLLASFLRRLAGCTRRLRALPAPSVAVVQGAALAGGCALVMACDLAVGCPATRLGYPVHAIGLSPAVSGPVLDARVGSGAARSMLVGGELVEGERALHLGLLHRLAPTVEALPALADELVASLLAKGPHALVATKRWLLDLDRSIDPARGAGALAASVSGVGTDESRAMLLAAWNARRKG